MKTCDLLKLTSIDVFFFSENEGIYEAIDGDFLDADSLSLLNPYMVSDFVFLALQLSSLSCNFLNIITIIAAQFKCFMVISKSNVSKAKL